MNKYIYIYYFSKIRQTHAHAYISWDLCLAILEWINKLTDWLNLINLINFILL
jgi:hypothetical protein